MNDLIKEEGKKRVQDACFFIPTTTTYQIDKRCLIFLGSNVRSASLRLVYFRPVKLQNEAVKVNTLHPICTTTLRHQF